MALPLLVTALTFPESAVAAWHRVESGGRGALVLVLVLGCFLALLPLGLRPRPGEPNVHDRQLDVILGLPLLAVAGWLTLSWPTSSEWVARDGVAFVAFLVASMLLIMGTRATLRLRWALMLPLLSLPALTDRPALLLGITALVVGFTAAAVRGHLRSGRALAMTSSTSHVVSHWQISFLVLLLLAGGLGYASQPANSGPTGSVSHVAVDGSE